jgi:hypothetical protein
MDFFHQCLERAPTDFAEIPFIVGRYLFPAVCAIDLDVSPAQVAVRFPEAAITDKCGFRGHARD